MLSMWCILAGIVVVAFSGLPACLMSSRSETGQRITTALVVVGGLAGLFGTVQVFHAAGASVDVDWFLPIGRFSVSADPLSAAFLVLVFIAPILGSVYGLGYWGQREHPENGRRVGLFYGLLAGSMGLVVIARDGVLFLLAWEIMALSAYFASSVEDTRPQVRSAGWVYLVATHVGTLCLFALFALWGKETGATALVPSSLPVAASTAVFVLALIGFGFKAGLVPFHVWLPGAHANAPSHVSALMSGVMLKMGIYGILRITSLVPVTEAWWGWSLLVLGALTGILGIAFAVGQSDLKRILAYSSIENIGIILMGTALALLGRALGRWDWTLLGLAGALLHVWNHGLFKSLLFLNAGAIIHAVGTREIDGLGGLGKRIPATATLFLIGAVAISALPPLNGFVGEWLIYLGLFKTLGGEGVVVAASLAAVALATIGTLAVVCFVKLFAAVFLGTPRSDRCEGAHESGAAMIVPMILLAAACLILGLAPSLVLPTIETAVRAWAIPTAGTEGLPATGLSDLAPTGGLTILGGILIAALLLLYATLRTLTVRRAAKRGQTWDCGYAAPNGRMQYTGTSFSQSVVDLFRFILWPLKKKPKIEGPFPQKAEFSTSVPDAVLDRAVLPVFSLVERYVPGIRVFQQGQTHFYILYVLIITLILLGIGGLGVAE